LLLFDFKFFEIFFEILKFDFGTMVSLPYVHGGLHTPGVGSFLANPDQLSSPHPSTAGVVLLSNRLLNRPCIEVLVVVLIPFAVL
jgi:hypothetical protein